MGAYGGRPQDWAKVPFSVAQACLEAIPRLNARQALLITAAVAVGTGSLRKGEAEKTLRQWTRQAGYEPKPIKARTMDKIQEHAAAAGIAVVKVPKRKNA